LNKALKYANDDGHNNPYEPESDRLDLDDYDEETLDNWPKLHS